jgi:putative holliday junction resolvase
MAPLPPGPILAIDLGVKRTGLARSDPGRSVAFGLQTFENKPGRSLKRHLAALHAEIPLTGVVIGFPLHMDGRPGELAGRVQRLGEWISIEFGIPVAYWDERQTTSEAIDMLAEAPWRKRTEKGARDRLAAQLILRDFLASGCPFPPAGATEPDDNSDAGSRA